MGEVALRKLQAGIETTRGTAVAATRKVYATANMTKDVALMAPMEDRGTFVRNYRSVQGVTEAAMTAEAGASYEDLAWWFQLMLKGGVTGVVRGITAYDYTFVPSGTTDDLKSATFEWGDETQAFQMPYGMVDSWSIEGTTGDFWKLNATLIGSDMAPITFTAALGDRIVEDVNMYLTKLAIGVPGAVPSSYMTGRFISFKLSGNNGLARKYFADGAAPTIGGMGRAKRELTLELTFEGNAATITERGVWVTGTSRVARITALGSVIAGSTGSIQRTVDIVFPGRWQGFAVGDRDTNTIFTAVMRNEYDATLAYDISAVVTNAVAALP